MPPRVERVAAVRGIGDDAVALKSDFEGLRVGAQQRGGLGRVEVCGERVRLAEQVLAEAAQLREHRPEHPAPLA